MKSDVPHLYLFVKYGRYSQELVSQAYHKDWKQGTKGLPDYF